MIIRNLTYNKAEFSLKDLILTRYENCIFEGVNFENKKFYNCEFYSCEFFNCKFNGCDLGLYKKGACGLFAKCKFSTCNFRHSSFGSIFLNEIVFDNCNFTHAAFEGTSMTSVIFLGKVNFCRFYCLPMNFGNNLLFFFENRYIKSNPAVWRNVDFSKAILKQIEFGNGMVFDEITFGNHEYVLLPNKKSILEKICDCIEALDIDTDCKNISILILRDTFDLPQKKAQHKIYYAKESFYNKKCLLLTDKIFEVLKKYHQP
jgi:uncharacterized protein YjbI with pentapeptide repeats